MHTNLTNCRAAGPLAARRNFAGIRSTSSRHGPQLRLLETSLKLLRGQLGPWLLDTEDLSVHLSALILASAPPHAGSSPANRNKGSLASGSVISVRGIPFQPYSAPPGEAEVEALGPSRSGQPQSPASEPAGLPLDLGSGTHGEHGFTHSPSVSSSAKWDHNVYRWDGRKN